MHLKKALYSNDFGKYIFYCLHINYLDFLKYVSEFMSYKVADDFT